MTAKYPTPVIARRFGALRRELKRIKAGETKDASRARDIRYEIEDLLCALPEYSAVEVCDLLREVSDLAGMHALDAALRDGHEEIMAGHEAELARLRLEIRGAP